MRPTTKADEIEDFVNKKQDKALTETDYLILTEYSRQHQRMLFVKSSIFKVLTYRSFYETLMP